MAEDDPISERITRLHMQLNKMEPTPTNLNEGLRALCGIVGDFNKAIDGFTVALDGFREALEDMRMQQIGLKKGVNYGEQD